MLPIPHQLCLYEKLQLIRQAEEAVSDLRRDGVIGTPCHLYTGQEAIAVGVCDVLRTEDTIWGTHRSHGHYLSKGGQLNAMMAEIFGKRAGCAHGRGGSMHLVATEVGVPGTVPIVAATIPMAVGAALASRLKNTDAVSVAFFGDGATEEGHFHEALNLAAQRKLPTLFVCENNLQASHLHLLERRPADNLDRLGDFYQATSLRVDGNDVLAVREAAEEAVARARMGDGPTFLECRTYRWKGHVDWREDDDVGLKRSDDLRSWKPAKCPIRLMERQLVGQGVAMATLEAIRDAVALQVSSAIDFARSADDPNSEELLTNVFAGGGN